MNHQPLRRRQRRMRAWSREHDVCVAVSRALARRRPDVLIEDVLIGVDWGMDFSRSALMHSIEKRMRKEIYGASLNIPRMAGRDAARRVEETVLKQMEGYGINALVQAHPDSQDPSVIHTSIQVPVPAHNINISFALPEERDGEDE